MSALASWSSNAPHCPGSFNCNSSSDRDLVSFDIGRVPSYVSIASSLLSCLGSLLILLAYCVLKDMRTGAQKVITLLAIADFFTAFGYIIGAGNFLTHFDSTSEKGCKVFTTICEIQSYITTWSTLSSFCWTCTLALYFFLILVFRNQLLAARMLPLYNVIAWIGPFLIVLPLLGCGKLGYAPYVASNWCYIKHEDYHVSLAAKSDTIFYIFIAGKLWEMLTYAFILALYIFITVKLRKTTHVQNQVHSKGSAKVVTVEKRLLAIPLLFIFIRMWGTLQFFYSLAVAHTNKDGCIPKAVHTVFLVFGILQAIGDGAQGWCNALLYILCSKTTRKKLLVLPFKQCLKTTGETIKELLKSTTTEQRQQVGDPETTLGMTDLEEDTIVQRVEHSCNTEGDKAPPRTDSRVLPMAVSVRSGSTSRQYDPAPTGSTERSALLGNRQKATIHTDS